MARHKVLKTALALCSILFSTLRYAGGCGGGAQADMGFIVDASGSVGAGNFQTTLVFVKDLVDTFDIGSNLIRVGFLKYDTGTYPEFHLNRYYDKNTMKNVIVNVYYTRGGTRTDLALQAARTTMFQSGNGDRSNVPNIAVVITDGRSWTAPASEATNLKNTGCTVFALGVGSGIPVSELNSMASLPLSDHVFTVNERM